jgi:hypothetical protein
LHKRELVRFGQIRRGEKFRFGGQIWKRYRGTFAHVDTSFDTKSKWPFAVSEMVEKVAQ